MRRSVIALLLLVMLAAAAPAHAEVEGEGEAGERAFGIERAREELGSKPPRSRFEIPAGNLSIAPAELLAGAPGGRVGFTVHLDRPGRDAALIVTLPALWVARARGGLPYTRGLRLERSAGGRAHLRRAGRTVELELGGAAAGDEATFSIEDNGLEAGAYALPFAWRTASGALRPAGTARVVVYGQEREGLREGPWERLRPARIPANASGDSTEESETFVSVVPSNADRVAVSGNDIGGTGTKVVFLSGNRGNTWSALNIPNEIDAPGEASPEDGSYCCDPMSAADALGNIWFGGLAFSNGAGVPSRIVVNRIGAGTSSFQTLTTGLPERTGSSTTQDKPLMTIDNAPGSPTFGRLYVVWDEPDANTGAIRVVVTHCDTRPAGILDAARCDNADNWTPVASITPGAGGNFIYADIAVGPDGRVYMTYWHYGATNAIEGQVCNPSTANCASSSGWSAPRIIATLDATGGEPIPFACPIMAQPGGRAAPEPMLDVDRSGGPENGRVYVTWADLRAGSGSTRCSQLPNGFGFPPAPTHLSWDVFVASAPGGEFPGGNASSTAVATRALTDGEDGGQSSSDEWFSSVAVDQSTGQAWVDYYSTRDDLTRRTTHFYARGVTPNPPGSTSHFIGPLMRASANPSDYSTSPCCSFGNDYGDYEGLDLAQGRVFPVWTDNSGGDGEVFTVKDGLDSTVPSPPAPPTTPPPPAPPAGTGTRGAGAPVIGLRYARRQKLARTGRLTLSVRALEAVTARVTARLSLPGGASKTIRLRKVARRLAAGKRVRLRVRLSRSARRAVRRALARRRRASVRFTITATAPDGRSAALTRRVRARR